MIDGTPLYLRVWGTLEDDQKLQVITKFGGTAKFDVRNEKVQKFLVENFGKTVRNTPFVVTK